MKKMMGEFREFIAQGNVLDMAIGVIIGGAFGKIVSSLVDDVIMPLISLLVGGIDFTKLFVALDGGDYASLSQAQEAGVATLSYGNFIQNVVDFLIIALVIFLVLRQMTKLSGRFKKEEPAAAPTTKLCPFCKSEIDIEATRCPHCTSQLEGDLA
ncbi:MAG: large conductance mechanosensitive channel protein MscL [Tissierellia bacterium]|nr:large conductance mechanosensitive channel protein MscL [Tissierellia bacterium]